MNNNILKLKQRCLLIFLLSLIFSILGVLSVPGIIIGATNSIIALLVISIVFAVHSFYGLTFWWIYYANLKQRLLILKLIEEQNFYNITEIASQLSTNEDNIKLQINWLINKQYLSNYYFDGINLTINNRKKQQKEQSNSKCPCCGSNLTIDNNISICEYCGYKKNI